MTGAYGSKWGNKIADFVFLPNISFIIAFTALEVLENQMWRVYIAGQIYKLTPSYGLNWVIKCIFALYLLCYCFNSFRMYEVFTRILDIRSYLHPDPPL